MKSIKVRIVDDGIHGRVYPRCETSEKLVSLIGHWMPAVDMLSVDGWIPISYLDQIEGLGFEVEEVQS